MAQKLQVIDKRSSPSPTAYTIPSKVVEAQGKTFGLKITDKVTTNVLAPGPGSYAQEKLKNQNLHYSMGTKLKDLEGL